MKRKNKLIKNAIPEVIANPTSAASEQYRTIATNIAFILKDKKLSTFAISSAEAGAGKSTTALNVASALAQQGKRVLLIDGDLRKPTLHKKAMISNSKGLSSIIVKDIPINECITKMETLPNLAIVPAGPISPNPTELINSNKMSKFIEYIKSSNIFDIVVVDTPPILVVNDTISIMQYLDAISLVARHNKSRKTDISECLRQLNQIKAINLGVILNDQPKTEHNYYYGA